MSRRNRLRTIAAVDSRDRTYFPIDRWARGPSGRERFHIGTRIHGH